MMLLFLTLFWSFFSTHFRTFVHHIHLFVLCVLVIPSFAILLIQNLLFHQTPIEASHSCVSRSLFNNPSACKAVSHLTDISTIRLGYISKCIFYNQTLHWHSLRHYGFLNIGPRGHIRRFGHCILCNCKNFRCQPFLWNGTSSHRPYRSNHQPRNCWITRSYDSRRQCFWYDYGGYHCFGWF